MPIVIVLLFFVFLSVPAAEAEELTARDFLLVLPGTIFENTPEGLPEEEKQQLLESGQTDFWELRNEDSEKMDLVARPFGESGVALRVFRGGKKGDVAVIGTTGTALCTIELWRADANGRIVPMDAPEEPSIKDFFGNIKVPAEVKPEVLFCVSDSGLEASPVFWNSSGMAHVPVNFRVRYIWRDGQFKKELEAIKR